MKHPYAAVVLYLGLQAFAVTVWWCLLVVSPDLIPLFRSQAMPDSVLLDLWLADLSLIALGSALVSGFVYHEAGARVPAAWFLTGAVWYAALFSVGGSLRSGGGWLAVALMSTAAIITFACAISVTRR